MAGRSASGSGSAVAASRHRSRAPGGCPATYAAPAIRLPRPCFRSRTFVRASSKMRTKALGLPDLELVTEPDERHRVGDPGMRLHRVRQDDTPLRIDLQNLARPEQRRRQLIPLVRIGRQRRQKRIDLVQKRIAACVQCRRVERRMDVEALEPVPRQHGPERCGDRNPTLGVQAIGEIGHEAVMARALCPLESRPRGEPAVTVARAGTRRCLPAAADSAPPDPPRGRDALDSMGRHGRQRTATLADLRR